MKRISISAVLILAAVGLYAATTGTLTLQGTVQPVLDITVTPASDIGALDLSIDVSSKLIGTVVERSNKKGGYTVSISSSNAVSTSGSAAYFKSTDPLIADTLEYTVSYDGSVVDFSSGSAVISDVSAKTTGAGTSKDVTIGYNGASGPLMYEGAYSDTLTFEIEAK